MHPEQYLSPEGRRSQLIEQNLVKMKPGGEMNNLLAFESMGGNAGGVEMEGRYYPCIGMNGYFDRHTGEIKVFGNIQEVPEEIRDGSNYEGFIFRITSPSYDDIINKRRAYKLIISVHYKDSLGRKVRLEPENEAEDVLKETAERYNIQKAKTFDDLYFILEATGNLRGTNKFYTPKELVTMIEKVRQGKLTSEHITRRGGLRDKVIELMGQK
ncbi:MAG: hypothetical protein AB1465_02385 [Patescibacteria group bacterium]